jgi:hypothetical protein
MRSLDSVTVKDVVDSSLNEGCVGMETSVKVDHTQETSELADSPWRGTGLKICGAFRERLVTSGRDLVA